MSSSMIHGVTPRFAGDNLPVPVNRGGLPVRVTPAVSGDDVIDAEVISVHSGPVKPPRSKLKAGVAGLGAIALVALGTVLSPFLPNSTSQAGQNDPAKPAIVQGIGEDNSLGPAAPGKDHQAENKSLDNADKQEVAKESDGVKSGKQPQRRKGIRRNAPVLQPGDPGYIPFVAPIRNDAPPGGR